MLAREPPLQASNSNRSVSSLQGQMKLLSEFGETKVWHGSGIENCKIFGAVGLDSSERHSAIILSGLSRTDFIIGYCCKLQ